MNKQCALAALIAITGLMSGMTFGAREQHTFEVSLTVPNRSYYIVPAQTGWIHQPQRLEWNHLDSTLGGLRKDFDVRSSEGAIEARLEYAPYLSNGRQGEEIPLRVSFNAVELSDEVRPREVVSRQQAGIGSRVVLDIQPHKPVDGYKPGDYDGYVVLLFNIKAPGE